MRTPRLLSYNKGKERIYEAGVEKCKFVQYLKTGAENFLYQSANVTVLRFITLLTYAGKYLSIITGYNAW